MKIPARFSCATAFLVIHADGHASVVGHRDRVVGVGEAALALRSVARAALELATNLKTF